MPEKASVMTLEVQNAGNQNNFLETLFFKRAEMAGG
jgi:hypothetical protein